jgi:hypothetical protein
MMGAMSHNVRNLGAMVLLDKDLLYGISNGISLIREEEGLSYGVEFLIGVIREFAGFTQ